MKTAFDWGRFCSFFYFIVEIQMMYDVEWKTIQIFKSINGKDPSNWRWKTGCNHIYFDSFIYIEENHETLEFTTSSFFVHNTIKSCKRN